MQGKTILCCALFMSVTPAAMYAAGADKPESSFQVAAPTGIPGQMLGPGQYSISVVDHLSDRAIIRVEDKTQHHATLLLAIPNKSMALGAHPGAIRWNDPVNGNQYMRGWSFAATSAPYEFVYPKDDAVALAKANNAQVPAIDPASEGMIANAGLSQDQMHIITLWLLSPARVGPKTPGGVQAQRWQPQLASNEHKPVAAKLPHTASTLPIWWALGTLSFVAAAGMRVRRASAQREA